MPAGSAPDTATGKVVAAVRLPSETVTVSVARPTPTGLTVSVRVLPVPVLPPVATPAALLVTLTVRALAGLSASAMSTVRTAGGLNGSPMVSARGATGSGAMVGAVLVGITGLTVTVAVRLSALPATFVTRTQ